MAIIGNIPYFQTNPYVDTQLLLFVSYHKGGMPMCACFTRFCSSFMPLVFDIQTLFKNIFRIVLDKVQCFTLYPKLFKHRKFFMFVQFSSLPFSGVPSQANTVFSPCQTKVEPSGKTGPQAVSWLILWGAFAFSRVQGRFWIRSGDRSKIKA